MANEPFDNLDISPDEGKTNIGVKVQGYARLVVHDKDGNLKTDTGWNKNNFTNAGKAYCATKVGGVTSPAAMDYLAVGTSTQVEADTDTALIAEIVDSGLERAQDASPTVSTTTVTDDTLEINYSWSVTGTKAIEEIGVLNAAAAGTLIGRSTLAATVNVANGDTCNGLYKIIFA